ncbi:hypothetical protein GJR96_16565 [Haloferax sp. MBLA0076]|uniref:Uncharacterized protein n=1 Tax=Haloferax litoreum TaxID=2666140 RepID=A0A6A8GKZ7_9EURY|nr:MULTISPECIES: hypothetical protein [Haloferax]KAB1190572.1 hypothetical protein Hfx1148_16510 [Haloferax sp. CBA1148]MRX23559.1 hypothetical protein [Haloferax litoreum]
MFRYIPTWTPGRNRQLGDIGYFDRGVFERRTSLDDFDIGFTIRTDPAPADYITQASRGVDIKFSAKGELDESFQAITKAEAGARIEFSRRNAFVFSAPNCHEHEIENKTQVKRELLRILEAGEGDWDENYAVVTDLVQAASATIIISGSSNSAIELRATGDVGQDWYSLAGISANAEMAWSRGSLTKVITSEGITPLFQPIRVKKHFLSRLFELWRTDRPSVDEYEGRDGIGGVETGIDTYGWYEEDAGDLFEWAYEDEEMTADLFEELSIDDILESH